MYIGIDLDTGSRLYWDLHSSRSPHALVVGPTGSGKSVTLATIARRISAAYDAAILVLDLKGEYRSLLAHTIRRVANLNPLSTPIRICSQGSRNIIEALVDTLSSILSLTEGGRRLISEILSACCTACKPINEVLKNVPIYELGETAKALEALSLFFDSCQGLDMTTIAKEFLQPKNALILDLEELSHYDYALIAPLLLTVLTTVPRLLGPAELNEIRLAIVLDEAWSYLPYATQNTITKLLRLARSYGISLLMATQSIDDLSSHAELAVSNSGLLIALASSYRSYWTQLARYLNLNPKLLNRALELQERGEGVALIAPSRTPRFIYVDPLDEEELRTLLREIGKK